MHCLIFTGGHTDLPFAKEYVRSGQWDMIITADFGLHACKAIGLDPDLILGDFDSTDPELLCYYEMHYADRMERFPAQKDETDTELAILRAIQRGADTITILGGTGSRIDHVLGNIQLLKLARDAGVDCRLVDANNRIRLIDRPLILHSDELFGDYVSLLPFTPEVTGLTLRGFAYEVTDFTLKSGVARGISNEVMGDRAEISFTDGMLLVIESRD